MENLMDDDDILDAVVVCPFCEHPSLITKSYYTGDYSIDDPYCWVCSRRIPLKRFKDGKSKNTSR